MTQALIVYLRSHRVVFQQVFLVNLSHPCFYIINQMIISKRCVSFLTHRLRGKLMRHIYDILLDYFDINIHILIKCIDKQYLYIFYYCISLLIILTAFVSRKQFHTILSFCVIICLRSSNLYPYVTSISYDHIR